MSELLRLAHYGFTYPQRRQPALSDVSLTIRSGEFWVLCGASGCGKTTLLRQLKPALRPHGASEGEIWFDGRLLSQLSEREQASEIGFVLQSPEEQTVTDKVWHELAFGLESLGCDTETVRRRVAEMASFFGIQDWFHRSVDELSGGQKQLLALASVMVLQPRLLILDEPSAALTDIEVEGLFAIMRKLVGEGKSIIFISHKMREVLHISDRITVLRLGEVIGTVDRADTDGQKLANMMIGKELSESQYDKVDASGAEVVASLEHVDYNKEHKHSGVNDMSLEIHSGEIVGIAGVDGNGQTQLAQLVTGVIVPQSGSIHLKGKNVAVFDPNAFIGDGVSHVPEDRNAQGLVGDMSIAENLALKETDSPKFSKGKGLLLNKRAIHDYAEAMVEKYDVRCTSVSQTVRSLSGGNQQKVILARELESSPSLLVAAHPTRGLDIGAASFVHEQMIAARERGVGILLISADFDEILEMSDRILVCFEGQIMGEFSGKNPPIEEISLAMTGK